MKPNEYAKLAKRSSAKLSDKRWDDFHMFLGMMTELAELADVFKKNLAYGKEIDWVNVEEEIGDFMWYVAGYSQNRSFDLDKLFEFFEEGGWVPKPEDKLNSNIILIFSMQSSLSEILSLGSVIGGDDEYEWDEWKNTLENLKMIIGDIQYFCYSNRLDLEKIMERNIEKLQARYPEKFTEENAINRNLEKERSILEK